MSTLKTTNIQNASSATTNIALDTSGNVTVGNNVTVGGGITASAGTVVMSSPYTMRNKIINGAMVIDQRNAGASLTANNQYTLDRWYYGNSQSGKFTIQQNAGSVTPPAGYSNYLGCTSTSAYSVLAGDQFYLRQAVEAFNTSDLAWGTSSAQSVTLSFWVRSSITGTFGGIVQNSAVGYGYPFTYTISSANTWEQKTITISGPTGGTWLSGTNGVGLWVYFDLGTGSNWKSSAGSWQAAGYTSATGATTSVVGTNGATWYVTGVQLERGTVATPFEYRNYQQELAMCQRYFTTTYNIGTAIGTATGLGCIAITCMNNGANNVGNNGSGTFFPVKMRTSATVTLYPIQGTTTAGNISVAKASTAIANYAGLVSIASQNGFNVYSTASGSGGTAGTATEVLFHYTSSAEL